MAGLARRVGVTVATVLFATSCGSDGGEPLVAAGVEEPTAEVVQDDPTAPEPEQTAVPETSTAVTATPVAVEPEEFVNAVNELLSERQYAGALADLRYILLQQDSGIFHITFDAELWRDLGATHSALASGLTEPPAEFADLAETFREANLALAERWAVAADDLEADAEAEALENYELPEDWDTYLETNFQAEDAVLTACVALRDSLNDRGFGLINCVGGVDIGELEWKTLEDCLLAQRVDPSFQCSEDGAEDDGDPTTVEPGESELTPGARYTFNAFDRPFALTIGEPTQVNVSETLVQIAPVDSDLWSMFWILAVDEIADPAAIVDNPNGLGPLIDMPDNFGGWVEGLPFGVANEGESTFGDATVPYWRLEAPVEPASTGPPDWYDFARSGPPLGRDGIFWLLPHPDGPLIVYTLPFADEPLGRTADEKFAYVEATLRTLELIPSS